MTVDECRFDMTYKNTMSKLDYAIDKGLVDLAIVPWLKKYNKLDNTYTTSSCVGRILVLGLDEQGSKKPNLFVGKWHRTVKLKDVTEKLDNDKFDELWLKQEPFILHLVVKNMDLAKKVLKAKFDAGIKRGGIISIKEGRIIIEIVGSSNLATPVKINHKVIFNKRQLGKLVHKSNYKLKQNYKQLKKFLGVLYKEMKNQKVQ